MTKPVIWAAVLGLIVLGTGVVLLSQNRTIDQSEQQVVPLLSPSPTNSPVAVPATATPTPTGSPTVKPRPTTTPTTSPFASPIGSDDRQGGGSTFQTADDRRRGADKPED